MRKNSPRKWLHAVLDLLPVILIPVFMIYSHRHTIDSGSIQVQEKQVVDFNQLANVPNWTNSSGSYGLSIVKNDYSYTLDGTLNYDSSVTSNSWLDFNLCNAYNEGPIFETNHVYYLKFYPSSVNGLRLYFYNIIGQNNSTFFLTTDNSSIATFSGTCVRSYCRIRIDNGTTFNNFTFNVQLFDLTQMFGSGNEPTKQEFDDLFNLPVYEYTASKKMLVDGDLVIYDDTDIMSQMTYQLYNSVDKYFNMGNVFNLNGVYDWFNLNIFNGTAPIYVYIVWQIVLYEFVMDLLFLLYGLFMWFIDMVEHLMDKPFKSIK